MPERPSTQPATDQEQKTKSYRSSIEEVVDYLEERTNQMRQRRAEGKGPTLQEVATNLGDFFEGVGFLKSKGPTSKTIGKETFSGILQDPSSWEDLLTQGAANAQRTVAQHIREKIEKKVEIKGNTTKSLLDLEEEEQRLAAMRAHLEAAEALVQDRKKVLTGGQRFTTVDSKESLKNEGQQAATRRRESGQRSADGFFARVFAIL